ncbi:MAG: helix-turn-helix domain-containing protein [Bacteroidetes bacterium]|nr:helix-turn-helix domain-containing protein [Bacteroidota bacterium]
MNTYFSTNIKLLRNRKDRTQVDIADSIGVSRSVIANYEFGNGKPTIDNTLALAEYFGISMDTLIKVDLAKLSESQLSELERGFDVYVKGSKLRVLTTTIDSQNNENIEVVSHKAKAGYTAGYNDPEFITALPTFQLPFLSQERKYRTFQIDGDSMLPIPDKSYAICEFVQNWHEIKDGNAYIIVTREEGIVFKVAFNQIRKKQNLLLKSLNTLYEPYEININEVIEVWKLINYMSSELPHQDSQVGRLLDKINDLKEEASRMMGQGGIG